MIVPSSNPSYHSTYTPAHLDDMAASLASGTVPETITTFISQAESSAVRGYLMVLAQYLMDAQGPRLGQGAKGARTALWGLQRPPLRPAGHTVLRCEEDCSFDALAPYLLPWFMTNARPQVTVSLDPSVAATILPKLEGAIGQSGQPLDVVTEAALKDPEKLWNVVDVRQQELDPEAMPLVGQFTSLLFPLGHIKSAKSDDQHFVETFISSPKWLRVQLS